jgi:hypothetical protein
MQFKTFNLSSQCPKNKMELCYILDDNAYILSDPESEHAGKFFGDVERKLMQIMIEDKTFDKTRILDYQAVCYEDREIDYETVPKKVRNSSLRAVLSNPLQSIFAVLTTILTVVQALPSFMPNCELNCDERNESCFHFEFVPSDVSRHRALL